MIPHTNMRIHKGDTIVVISGKDRGKVAKVLRVLPASGKIVADGVNIHKRHRKPRRAQEKGQIISFPTPIFVAQAKVICSKCEKATRIGYKGAGKDKMRVCKKCGEKI
jgi:large subunit ribosomal protein L24